MAWTEITRRNYRCDGLRYGSGTAGREWAEIEPLLPAARRLGRPRRRDLRTIVGAVLYIPATGCQRGPPKAAAPPASMPANPSRARSAISSPIHKASSSRLELLTLTSTP